MQHFILSLLFYSTVSVAILSQQSISTPPAPGDKAPDFALVNQEGKRVRLSDMTTKTPVVLVVLRGFPGYQCPLCNLQVHEFVKNAQGFAEAKVQVILVYPGPPENLAARATEFTADKNLPDNFQLLLDPGYEFTHLYGLRWDAPGETAYPSTFLIDQRGIVFFSRISRTHGGRTKAAELLEVLMKRKAT